MNERQEQFNDQGYGQAFRGQGSSPTYGFSNSYQPSPQAQAFAQVLEALQDPRNQWIGTGLMGGTVKGLGGLRGFFEAKEAARMGGFRPSLKELQHNPNVRPNPNVTLDETFGASIPPRQQYFNDVSSLNDTARSMESGNPLLRMHTERQLDRTSPQFQQDTYATLAGRKALQDQNQRAMTQTEGPPPEMVRRLFGL